MKISVITVTYNAAQFVEGTILSVLAQTYKHIEYVIIDGGSKDGTLDIIKKYETSIARWVSEPDKGLYDAMNKGIQSATGDFILFMNAGDRFFANDALEVAIRQSTPDTDILYGETMYVDEARHHLGTRSQVTTQQLPEQLLPSSFRMGMVVSHQSLLVRRSIAPSFLLNNLSADIDWTIRAVKAARKTQNTHQIIAEFLVGGVSKQRHWASLKGRFAVLSTHYGLFPTVLAHIAMVGRAAWHRLTRLGKPVQ